MVTLPDALEKFRPKRVQVLVDETVLTMRPLSVAAQGEFLREMSALDWTPVLERLQPIVEGVFSLNLEDKGTAAAIMAALPMIARDGLALVQAALGVALAPAAGVLLDNEANFKALVEAQILTDDHCEREHIFYLRSPALRAYVAASVTAVQAEHILVTAWELNGWKDLVGKAMAALKTRAGAAPVNGTKPALETVTG